MEKLTTGKTNLEKRTQANLATRKSGRSILLLAIFSKPFLNLIEFGGQILFEFSQFCLRISRRSYTAEQVGRVCEGNNYSLIWKIFATNEFYNHFLQILKNFPHDAFL